jgi:predicted alpha/beta hydrolase family esterase
MNASVPVVIVPGVGDSAPDHWQSHIQRKFAYTRRVIQADWQNPICSVWIAELDRVLDQLMTPAVLVGHSAGTMAIVHWAARYRRPVHGALLVAPSDFEMDLPGFSRAANMAAGWVPIPRQELPFRSIVVASDNDPWVAKERADLFAGHWGSEFVDVGPAGHINVDSGFGPWPEAVDLIERLLSSGGKAKRSVNQGPDF